MRRFTLRWVGCVAVLASIGACDGSDNQSGSSAAGGGATVGTTSTTALDDGQVALVILDANGAEVGDGGLGLARATSAEVLAFAQTMVTDHTTALAHVRSTIAAAAIVPAQSTAGQQRSVASLGVEQQLRMQPLDAFDAAFICREVDAHAALLEVIDTQGQAAMHGPLAGELQMARATAAAHLDLASRILTSLMNAEGGKGDVTQFCAQFEPSAGSM